MEGSPEVTEDNWTEGVFSQMNRYNLTDEDKNTIKIIRPHNISNNVKPTLQKKLMTGS